MERTDQKTKVLMFGWEFPPYKTGGLGTACFGISSELAKNGVEVNFVLPVNGENQEKAGVNLIFSSVLENFKVFPFNFSGSPYNAYSVKDNASKSKSFGNLLKKEVVISENAYKKALAYENFAESVVSKIQTDVIHAHDWLTFKAGIKAKKITKKPLVVHIHSTEFDRSGSEQVNQMTFALEKEGISKADKIIVVSNYTKDILLKKYQAPKKKIEVVHNGVDFGFFNKEIPGYKDNLRKLKRGGKKIVLFLGRITIQKGPDHFLKIARKVLDLDPNVIFIMAGAGDMLEQVVQSSARLKITDKILFPGFVKEEEVRRLYKLSDVYVLPSVSEPFGISALEALASGTPAVISKQSGVSEVLKNVLKADFWDIDKMATNILAVLKYSSLRKILKDKGKKEVEEMTWAKVAKECAKIYEELGSNVAKLRKRVFTELVKEEKRKNGI